MLPAFVIGERVTKELAGGLKCRSALVEHEVKHLKHVDHVRPYFQTCVHTIGTGTSCQPSGIAEQNLSRTHLNK
jgi:hypothetical protein